MTQPLIVAKVGLQSRPPTERGGKPFRSFVEVMRYIVNNEGLFGLFKGIKPQIMKGILVQGLLMMIKEKYDEFYQYIEWVADKKCRMELSFILLFKAFRKLRSERLKGAAAVAAGKLTKANSIIKTAV